MTDRPVHRFPARDGLELAYREIGNNRPVAHPRPLLGKAVQASYATYVIHPLVLTAVMVAFARAALAAEIKLVLVAAAGMAMAACFRPLTR